MTVFKKDTTIESFPAYDVVERQPMGAGQLDPLNPERGADAINITAGDTVICGRKIYTAGSAASYALQYNNCPVAAYERAVENGHATHWLNQNCTVITSHDMPRETHVRVEPGMHVFFEGRLFTIERAPNDNLKLVRA